MLLFFLCWVIPTIIIFYLPLSIDFSPFQLHLVTFFFIGFYLVLASSLAYQVINKVLVEEKKVLIITVGMSIVLFFAIYGYIRFFESSVLIAASVSTANLLFMASIIGAGLSSAIKRLAELVPICVTAAIADLVSVLRGPTKDMIEGISDYYEEGLVGEPPIIDFIIIKAGIPGFDIPIPLFGMTDWIFIVLISSAMIRLGKTDNLFEKSVTTVNYLYFPVATAALLAGIVFAQITNSFIPAMVFISGVFLLFLAIKYKIHKEMEKIDIVYSIVFPVIIVSAILVFTG